MIGLSASQKQQSSFFHLHNSSFFECFYLYLYCWLPQTIRIMTLPVYHEDLCELFDRADCPFIFSRRCKAQRRLADLPASPSNMAESISAVQGVMQAVLYLRMNMITPCQLRFEYIVQCSGRWGLCHAICDRSEQVEEVEDGYNPEEYIFHLDSQNQLVWNIGKVWLRFLTDQPVKIKHNTQKKVDKIIDSCVPDQEAAALLKRLLCLDKTERIKFEDLLQQQLMSRQGEEEQTKFYSSLMVHLRNISGILGSKGGMSKFSQKNHYLRELNYRRFLEYLEVDGFLENVKSDMRKEYVIEDQTSKFNLEFTCYIISLQDYKNMVRLNTERLEQGERFEEINDRIYYAKFTQRMLILRDLVQRRARVLKNNPYLRKPFLKYLDDPDKIEDDIVYFQFKSCLSQYADYLKDELKTNNHDRAAHRLLAKIFIARTSGYIFNEFRSEIFQPLFRSEKCFNMKKVYSKINECDNVDTLKAVVLNIEYFYFRK